MTFTSLLIHTCDIGELNQAGANEYGTPAKTWPVTQAGQICRLMATTGREVKVGAKVVISDWKLFLPSTVSIDEQDRVSNFKLAATGVVIDASTYEVLLVQPRSNSVNGHHFEAALQKVA